MARTTFQGPVQSQEGFNVEVGTDKRMGTATLVAGTVTVSNTSVESGSRVFLQRKAAGGTVGDLTYTVVAGTSFTITSANAADTSTVDFLIVNPLTVNP